MADLDESPAVLSATDPSNTDEIDLSDETQDFRFLATLASSTSTSSPLTTKLPKRGEKDFEPHSTTLQSDTLTASRHAMHTALSYPRFHHPGTPKTYTRATYHPETNMAYTYQPRGPLFAKMGRVLPKGEDPFGEDGRRGGRVWLSAEEALYLVERGTLDLRWPRARSGEKDVAEVIEERMGLGGEGEEREGEEEEGEGKAEEEKGEEEEGLPMSLQGAYAMFVGDGERKGGLTLERYSVYTALKRIGYTVLRAPSWDGQGDEIGDECFVPRGKERTLWQMGLGDFWTRLFGRGDPDLNETIKEGPLVTPGLYRSYADVYRRLSLIDAYDPTKHHRPAEKVLPATDPNFRITYHVWKPGSTTFKKSAPGTPDFRIAVVNVRETTMPSLDQLSSLLDTTPHDPPKEGAQLYNKLKHGHKNVILAVVDQGVTSYLRVSDAGFCREKLYDRPVRGPGGKRGGRGGGRGRSRR